MSYSDYLSLKKIKNISKDKTLALDYSGSNHTRKKQFHQIQTTMILDEDNEIMDTQRFHIHVPPIYFPEMKTPKKKAMFSIPRIHVVEYVKNRYEPPFCWTCKIPIDDLTKEIACMVCNTVQDIPETIFELQESIDIDMNKYLDGSFLFDFQSNNIVYDDVLEDVRREILEKENPITIDENKNITIENNILFL